MSIEQEAMGALKTAISDVETEFNIVKDKVESLMEPAVDKVEAQAAPVIAQVEAQVQAAAPVIVSATAVSVSTVFADIKSILGVFSAVPSSFDTYAAPILKAGIADIDTAVTMFEGILAAKNVEMPAFWAEVVAAAKAL